jgi:hypothetical protein
VLGRNAAGLLRLDVRWSERVDPAHAADLYSTTFRFRPGEAPRVVEQRLRLWQGSYEVELQLASTGAYRVVRQAVTLPGGWLGLEGDAPVSIDVAEGEAAAHDVMLDAAATSPNEPR